MCILLPRNLYLRGVVAERPRSSSSTVFEAVVNRSSRTSPAVPAPYGGGPFGLALGRGARAP